MEYNFICVISIGDAKNFRQTFQSTRFQLTQFATYKCLWKKKERKKKKKHERAHNRINARHVPRFVN